MSVNAPNYFPAVPATTGLEIVQNTPADLTCLVNTGSNNAMVGGNTFGLNTSGITLFSPGVVQIGPFIAGNTIIVYYDSELGIFNFVSASSLQLPDYMHQVPLAAIVIPAGAPAVTQQMIFMLQSPASFPGRNVKNYQTVTTAATINAHGVSELYAGIITSSVTSCAITINNLRIGVPLFIKVRNSAGSGSCTVQLQANTPSGASYAANGNITGRLAGTVGGQVSLTTTGYALGFGNDILFMGATGRREDGTAPWAEVAIC